jgi:hypothetical protein
LAEKSKMHFVLKNKRISVSVIDNLVKNLSLSRNFPMLNEMGRKKNSVEGRALKIKRKSGMKK